MASAQKKTTRVRHHRRTLFGLVLALLCLIAAGCGSGGDAQRFAPPTLPGTWRLVQTSGSGGVFPVTEEVLITFTSGGEFTERKNGVVEETRYRVSRTSPLYGSSPVIEYDDNRSSNVITRANDQILVLSSSEGTDSPVLHYERVP